MNIVEIIQEIDNGVKLALQAELAKQGITCAIQTFNDEDSELEETYPCITIHTNIPVHVSEWGMEHYICESQLEICAKTISKDDIGNKKNRKLACLVKQVIESQVVNEYTPDYVAVKGIVQSGNNSGYSENRTENSMQWTVFIAYCDDIESSSSSSSYSSSSSSSYSSISSASSGSSNSSISSNSSESSLEYSSSSSSSSLDYSDSSVSFVPAGFIPANEGFTEMTIDTAYYYEFNNNGTSYDSYEWKLDMGGDYIGGYEVGTFVWTQLAQATPWFNWWGAAGENTFSGTFFYTTWYDNKMWHKIFTPTNVTVGGTFAVGNGLDGNYVCGTMDYYDRNNTAFILFDAQNGYMTLCDGTMTPYAKCQSLTLVGKQWYDMSDNPVDVTVSYT